MRRWRTERGAALVEAAITIPCSRTSGGRHVRLQRGARIFSTRFRYCRP